MTTLRLTFLGTFAVQRDDVPITGFRGDKVRALLAYLAVEAGRPRARGSLAGLFWPEQPQEAALNNLSQALGRLRAALGSAGPPVLLLTRRAVGWNTASGAEVDVTAFVRLARSTAVADLAAAAALYEGPFLPGFALPGCEEFEEWLALTREHLDRLAVGALDTLARAHLEGGSYAAAEAAARRQLALDPWRESAHRQVMAALAGAGQRAAALAHYAACRRALQDGLGVAPDAATTALYERLRAGAAIPEDGAPPAADTLPVALTPLVGREADLAALGALLRAEGVRLLTLVGAGGMGKTRLALDLARAQRAAFGDGVFLVPLAPLADVAAILPLLAATLGVTAPAGDLRQAVLQALRAKRLLLVLDNFEHLLDGAGLVADLLQAAPGVRIVATSREPLAVRGEHVYGVQGLAYAAGGAPAAAAPAVRLFVQAARRARADFTPRPADLAAILRICALVRGMPLGLELAAAWIGLLAPEEIAQEIARGADILAADWPDAPERQRSMRAVFAWSWALLDDAGRGALRRLSVFRGGFTREAAERVAGATLGAVAGLARASLVARCPGGDTGRYEIHELLRQFAAEQLDAVPGERAEVEARHGAYYLALAEAAEAEYAGPRQVAWLDRLEPDHDNIRAAQEWAARRGEVALELRLAGAVAYFWFLRGYHAEGRARLQHVLARPEAQAPSEARARALNAAGYFAWVDGDLGEAHAALAQAARIARAAGDRPTLAFGLCYLGAVANGRRDYGAAEALLAESLAIWGALGGDNNRGLPLMFLGDAALGRGERARARAAFAESADLLRAAGNVSLLPYPVRRLGHLAQEDGDLARAAACYAESLRLNREVGDRRGLAAALVGVAAVARDRGQWGRLARLVGAIEGLLRAAEARLLPFDQEHFERCAAALRARPDAAALDRARAEGRAFSPERAMAYAQEADHEQEPADRTSCRC